MLSEYRRLIFSPDELQLAVRAFHREKKLKISDGDIVGLVVVDKPHLCAQIQIALRCSAKTEEVLIDTDQLGAAMLFYCMKQKIPIPKFPKKIIKRAGAGLELSFSINPDPAFERPSDG